MRESKGDPVETLLIVLLWLVGWLVMCASALCVVRIVQVVSQIVGG